MNPSPPLPDLAEAYRGLHAALDQIEGEADRAVARDAVRDALDRSVPALETSSTMIVADTFAVEKPIHEGDAFVVLKLRHRDLGTPHALKTPRAERRAEPFLRDLLLREGRNHLRVAHPAVLPARAVLRLPDGRPGLLTDYIDGGSLATRLADGPLPEASASAFARRLMAALDAVHAAGLLHLDLSPANILLPGGRIEDALLADFGLSLPTGGMHRDGELAHAATPGFAAPEQVMGNIALDRRADLFALGRLVLRCLGGDAAEGGLHRWTARLCAADPAARPHDCAGALRLLEDEACGGRRPCGAKATLSD